MFYILALLKPLLKIEMLNPFKLSFGIQFCYGKKTKDIKGL